MVIGNGMIAKRFSSYRENNAVVIFASGVSNSSQNLPEAFAREENLLKETILEHPGKKLVYFSTCSVYDPSLKQSPYVLHKLAMESLIRETAATFTLFRVSNPVGKTDNPHTVFNFFIQHILRKIPFQVWKYASRNLMDIDDMFAVCDEIIRGDLFVNGHVNVANPVNYPVISIVRSIEEHFHTDGKYTLVDKGNSPLIDTTAVQELFGKLGIDFNNTYLPGLLNKYFPYEI